MDSSKTKHSLGNILLFSALFVAAIFVFLKSSSSTYSSLFGTPCHCHDSNNPSSTETDTRVKDNLDAALEEASKGGNQTIIIAMVNKAYTELDFTKTEQNRSVRVLATTMLDVFLESFWMGEGTRPLLRNLLLVSVDEASYQRCVFRGLHCYKLETEGVDFGGEVVYMSKDFIKMMWTRTEFLLEVLKRGYDFVFTDTDVMWLRNPFKRLSKNETYDIQISTDVVLNNVGPEKQHINTGFYHIKSNNKTVSLFEKWYSMKDNSTGMKEQDVLANLLRQGFFRQLGIEMSFLDTVYFSGFCENSRDVGAVVTVHANCCRSIRAKVSDLVSVLGDWQRFKEVGGNGTVGFRWTPHVGCSNSWRTPKGVKIRFV